MKPRTNGRYCEQPALAQAFGGTYHFSRTELYTAFSYYGWTTAAYMPSAYRYHFRLSSDQS